MKKLLLLQKIFNLKISVHKNYLIFVVLLLTNVVSADITCINNIITITESVKTIDIYNADILLGCNVITKQGNLQYNINGNIYIGNSTHKGEWVSKNEHIEWTNSNIWNSNSLVLYGNSIVRFGEIINNIPMYGTAICTNNLKMFSFKLYDNSSLYLYATKITDATLGGTYSMIRQSTTSHIIAKEVLLDKIAYGFYSSNIGATTGYHLDLENVVVQNCKYFFGAATDISILKLKNIGSHKTTNGIYIHSSVINDVIIKNYIQTTSNYLFDLRVSQIDCYMINANVNTWINRYSGSSISKVYQQNTFNLKIKESIKNINITLLDKFNNTVFSQLTYDNGSIDEKIVSYGFYDKNNVNIYLYSPHKLIITNQNYTTKEISINMSKPYNQIIPLKDRPNNLGYIQILGTDYCDNMQGEIRALVKYGDGSNANNINVSIKLWNNTLTNMTFISNGIYQYNFIVPEYQDKNIYFFSVNSSNPLTYGIGEFTVKKCVQVTTTIQTVTVGTWKREEKPIGNTILYIIGFGVSIILIIYILYRK